ncbi:MAG: hypothetical protein P9L92_18970 [Candidatus Electryonea clarkiae]|nr:hypothetical protein [Candidatus Electryonea clarkiae]MDP8285712.1 hypothetical protein [Candidatus Electryonea clarkiae]
MAIPTAIKRNPGPGKMSRGIPTSINISPAKVIIDFTIFLIDNFIAITLQW